MSEETMSDETRGVKETDNDSRLTTADLLRQPGQSNSTATANGDDNKPDAEREEPLVSDSDASNLRERWSSIQANFVDEPQESVEEADTLVAEVIQSLARRFADERQKLEVQWHGGGEASTEDLRQALRHYRSFFQRLLAA